MRNSAVFQMINSVPNGQNVTLKKTKLLEYVKTDPITGKKIKGEKGYYIKTSVMTCRIGVDYRNIASVKQDKIAAGLDPSTSGPLDWGHWYKRNGQFDWTGYVLEHSQGLSTAQNTYVNECAKIIAEVVGLDLDSLGLPTKPKERKLALQPIMSKVIRSAGKEQIASIRAQILEIPKPVTNWQLYLRITKPSRGDYKVQTSFCDENGAPVTRAEVESKVAKSNMDSAPANCYNIKFDDIIELKQNTNKNKKFVVKNKGVWGK